MTEESRVLLFVIVIFAVFALAAFFVCRVIYRRVKSVSETEPASIRWISRFVLLCAGLGVLCVAYGFVVEPYWPEVTHVQIRSAKISSPVRIVHISDIHSDPKPRLEQRLPGLIAAQKPDLIVYTGDSMNSEAAAPVFRTLLTELSKISNVYIARGNWDIGLPDEFFSATGARVIDGVSQRVEVRGNSLSISGTRVGNETAIPAMLKAIPDRDFSLFLHHWPDEVLDVARSSKVDLYCAGHTHGGQVALPWYGALITLSRFGKRFEAGLYRVENTWLYVNRGIGMEGGPAFRVRFLARPEVTVIDLLPQG